MYIEPAAARPVPIHISVMPPPAATTDLRPTADAAALSRDSRPELPLVMAAQATQIGAVSEALVASAPRDRRGGTELPAGQAVERTLKPYGIAMLPDRAADHPSVDLRSEADPTDPV